MRIKTKRVNQPPIVKFRFGYLFKATWGESKMYVLESYFKETLHRYEFDYTDQEKRLVLFRLKDMDNDLPKGFSPYCFIEIY